jgi:hypothetical protein
MGLGLDVKGIKEEILVIEWMGKGQQRGGGS